MTNERTIIKQIMPAPGWRVFCISRQDDIVRHFEMPVAGWALLDNSHRGYDDYVDLLVWYDLSLELLQHSAFFRYAPNAVYHALPPGDSVEAYLEDWTQDLDSQIQAMKERAEEKRKDRLAREEQTKAAKAKMHDYTGILRTNLGTKK